MEQQKSVVALNGDIVSYSQLLAEDHESTRAIVETFQQLATEHISTNNGTLVNFVGDNFMAVFSNESEALQTAISITSEIERRDPRISSSEKVRFRLGLDSGEVSIAEHQYYGDVLNIAARIQTMAKAGGICVSGRVYRNLDEPALRFRSIGKNKLKNIPELIEVFEFVDFPGDETNVIGSSGLDLESPSIAVLPIHIKNASSLVAEAADILRQELVHRLTAVPQLTVVNAKSEVGQQQGLTAARYYIETGVHQHGDRVRVFATLFDVTTMNIVKSYKWFVAADGLVELSERLAEDVAKSIEVELIVGEPAGLYAELDDPEAIEKIYLGWYHLRSDIREGWAQALELFGQVADSHPDHSYGHVLSAFANWIGAANGWSPNLDKALLKAQQQARTAREKGDPTGMSKAIEGAVYMSQGRHHEALAAIEQLEITRPTCDVTYGLEGSIRRYLGQWEKSVELLDTAMRLTGVNKPWYPTVKACSLFIGKQIEEAMTVAEVVLEYQPKNLEAHVVLAAAQTELGMSRRAKATIKAINEKFPTVDVVEWLDKNPYTDIDRVKHWKEALSRTIAATG